MPSDTGRAVVVGASVAGLLAAAALAPHYREVVVLDRDRLPTEPVPRGGVPQARHSHVLLEPGCAALEALLPGALAELVAAGAVLGDCQRRIALHAGAAAGPLAAGTSGLRLLAVDREVLEAWLRSRIDRLPPVRIRSRATVLDLVVSDDPGPARRVPGVGVVGVVVADLDHPARLPQPLLADLVVDASGRCSRLAECLAERGCAAPRVDRSRIDGRYVTRRFTLPDGAPPPGLLAGRDGVVANAAGRSAVLIRVAARSWLLTLAGYGGTRPPPELAGFVSYARDVGGPAGDLTELLEPSGAPLVYREPALVRRRFELLDDPGVVVVGDALCAVDAASGAGMSVAAVEAACLGEVLGLGVADVPRSYYRRTRRLVDRLWDGATRRHGAVPPPARSSPVSWASRLPSAYRRHYLEAAARDPVLARGYLRVVHLRAGPRSLYAPHRAARVLGGVPRHRRPPPA